MTMSFYVDTCIWLNLLKNEGDISKGEPYWKIAKKFIEYVKLNSFQIVVSGLILKEIMFKAGDKFDWINEFFKREPYIKLVKTTEEDYNFARKLEAETGFGISFYDCLHIAISKRLNLTLITRDKELIKTCNNLVPVAKPEDLIN